MSTVRQEKLRLAGLFQRGVVLQREQPVPVWGWGAPHTRVTLSFADHTRDTQIDRRGYWGAQLPAMPACAEPRELRVTAEGGAALTVTDVRVGEVWLCAGQSNMKITLGQTDLPPAERAALCDPLLAVGRVPERVAAAPEPDTTVTWEPVAADNAAGLPAVPFYFAAERRRILDVPVGVLVAAYGHTPIEAWLDRATLAADPAARAGLLRWEAALERTPGLRENLESNRVEIMRRRQASHYAARNAAWLAAARAARQAGRALPPAPERPTGPGDPWSPTVLYNAMIAPLVPFALRGVLWYQGETNAIFGNAFDYRRLLPALIRAWRMQWQSETWPFYYVQLANHDDLQTTEADEKWAELREAQGLAASMPHAAMAVTLDIGESDNIHPKNKRAVGERLARLAAAQSDPAPRFVGCQPAGDGLRLFFTPPKARLVLRSGRDSAFEVAGQDRCWHPARAQVAGPGHLDVSSPAVPTPVAVRYAWRADPQAILFGADGVPISPFRSDAWPRITQPTPATSAGAPLFLGLDLGTSKVAAVLTDAAGKVAATATREHEATVSGLPVGHAEQDPARLFAAATSTVGQLPAALRRRVAALGVTGQMHGLLLLGADARPLSRLITWQDNRCAAQPGWLEALARNTSHRLFPGYGCVTLAWLRRQAACPAGTVAAATIHDWLVARLCGLAHPVTDPTSGAGWGLFDLVQGRWDERAMAVAELPCGWFPDLLPSGTTAGVLCAAYAAEWGLPAHIPVAVAIGDNQASLLATLDDPEHELALTLGTGGQLSAVLPFPPPTVVPGGGVEYRPYLNGAVAAVAATLNGGAAWKWLAESAAAWMQELGAPPLERAALYDRLSELGLAAQTEVEVLPRFAGERFAPGSRGVLQGLELSGLSLGPLARGLARSLFVNLKDQLPPAAYEGRTGLVGSGNALRRTPLLRQMAADVFQLPLRLTTEAEEAACGAARLAQGLL